MAHDDRPLPIGHGQTISQPYIVAYMSELLRITPDLTVLEIGTGSGYQTAVLASLVQEVYTVERLEPLMKQARGCLRELGFSNVHYRVADGSVGWPEHAPYDAILVTAAPREVPAALVDQLAIGGRLVIPVGGVGVQDLLVLERGEHGVSTERIEQVAFVPLVAGRP
jgi:protein-L-isoaspartate(D-aspartate) O-methyltransferase